ncbi:hypothetical protein M3676_22215 [Metabacillus litoralis]|nr:hypothetical protein [Metabacillus litoralis]
MVKRIVPSNKSAEGCLEALITARGGGMSYMYTLPQGMHFIFNQDIKEQPIR